VSSSFLGIWWGWKKVPSSIFLAFEDEVLFGGSSTDRSLKKRRDEKRKKHSFVRHKTNFEKQKLL
tara:strand:- start:84 stop:278 length:195 start_codon:yes stop_codon:yes gene_type:complete